MKKSIFAVALLVLGATLAIAQGAPTTSTRILAANGPAFVTFYYQPGTQLVWEAKLVCNEYTGLLTLQFIQPAANEPDANPSFPNACTVTGAGTKDVTVTTTATPDNPLTFVDSDGDPEAITSLGWEATCESTRTGCVWSSKSNNGMSLLYQ